MPDDETEYPWLSGADRYRLAVTLGLGVFVGLTPIVFAMRRPWVFIGVLAIAIYASLSATGLIRVAREHQPDLNEHVQAGLTETFYAQWIGLGSGLVWLAAFWIARLIDRTSWDVNEGAWAFWVWFATMATVGAYTVLFTAWIVADDMYPEEPGIPSRFGGPLHVRTSRLVWLAVAIGIGIAVVAYATASWVDVVLFVGVFLVGFFGTPAPRRVEEIEPYLDAVENVAACFRGLGYDLIENPATDDDTVDPLLQGADLYAVRGPIALLVDVRVRGGIIDWPDATRIVTAADVLEDWFREANEEQEPIKPVVVIVDATASKRMSGFSEKFDLTVVEINKDAVGVYPEDTQEDLRREMELLGERYLERTRAEGATA